ncbi:MAG: Rhodanese- sulfurtransferase [Alectoria sarmentosa]|nr:MAG: Rhodanese- sulfurtransferase [Alectoria sarmentosa]CAD6587333.1 MAG: Rhodanese- sulfurtransferase [Alectoria sarmentosa]
MAEDSSMEVSQAVSSSSLNSAPHASNSDKSPITVTKAIPPTFDLGNLLCHDPTPLPSNPPDTLLASTARDCAQLLINQLLTTCPITSSPASGVLMTLPPTTFLLPREKPLPKKKEATKWEKFAKKKGIKDKKRGEGKTEYDEEKGEWVPKWGYKGRNKDGEGEWIVEVDEKKEKELESEGKGKTIRGEGRRDRVEKNKRNERKQRNNERKGRKAGGGG